MLEKTAFLSNPPTDRQTAPESDHGSSFSKLSHLILADYLSDKPKAKKKVTFVPQNPQLALVPTPSFLTSKVPPSSTKTSIPASQAQTQAPAPQIQVSKKRKGGPLEISRPLKQGRGKEPRVVSQVLGKEPASKVDVFFNTSLASVKRPIKKNLAAKKIVPNPVEVAEVAEERDGATSVEQVVQGREENEEENPNLAGRTEGVPSVDTRILATTENEDTTSEPRERGRSWDACLRGRRTKC